MGTDGGSVRRILRAAVVAGALSGAPSTVHALATGRDVLASSRAAGTPFGVLSILTGGQLSGDTIFALGIMPYVSAALIVQAFALTWEIRNRNASRRRDVCLARAFRS